MHKWQYALPWDPPRALVPVSALAGPTTSAAASFIVPTAVPKPSTPDPIAALTITSSTSISSIRLVAPSTDIRSQTENPDTSSLHPHPHPHSSRPIVASRIVRASTASGHIMAASQPVLTVIPYQGSTPQEKVTALRPLDPVISHPALLTDADSVVPASFTVSEAYSLGPSALMAISQITLTPTHRPTSTSATSKSLSVTSITYSSAPGSQISGEPTTSPGGPEAKTTALHLADDSKPTPSLASIGASSVSTLFGSLASTASITSPSHPVSNAARDLAGTRHGGVAIVVLVSMFYCLVV